MNGSDALLKKLKENGTDTVFGYPGGVLLPLYDSIYDCDIKHILVRHEQAAAHAADGYARVSGKPGVCIATSGPGATNLVTGIATANIDSSPVIALTGQVTTGIIGTDAFQEVDTIGLTMPITKENLKQYVWAYIPHLFYTPFYVYQYATSFATSFKLYKDVKENVPGAFEKYTNLLKSGGSKYPVEQVKEAGVDFTKKDAYMAVVERMETLVDELEKLLEE